MNELKPCPFCGGTAYMFQSFTEDVETVKPIYIVKCLNLSCISNKGKRFREEAVEAWNQRTEVARMEYDREEIHENCTVHVLWDSKTGESSIGWWRNDKPPEVIGRTDE